VGLSLGIVGMELRQGTEQTIRVGVLLTKQSKLTDPLNPVYGAQLDWYYWRYLVKPDGTVIDLIGHPWIDIPNCAGCYYLTLSASDTDQLGHLTTYIYDAENLGRPVFQTFYITNQNNWDSKYDSKLLVVEQQAEEG